MTGLLACLPMTDYADAVNSYSAYGHRQDDWYLLPESTRAHLLREAHAIASLMNESRDAAPERTHLEGARENAQRTYDRRRARKAADTLATIPPNRWDNRTRQIIATLATVSAPSRIDNALTQAFDGPTWEDMPEGTTDIREAIAADIRRLEAEHPVAADRRCRRVDHLPMGYHLPTACENEETR